MNHAVQGTDSEAALTCPHSPASSGVRSPRRAQVGAGNRGNTDLEQEGPRVLRKGLRGGGEEREPRTYGELVVEGEDGEELGGHAKQKGSRQVRGS